LLSILRHLYLCIPCAAGGVAFLQSLNAADRYDVFIDACNVRVGFAFLALHRKTNPGKQGLFSIKDSRSHGNRWA